MCGSVTQQEVPLPHAGAGHESVSHLVDTRNLGLALRSVYEASVDKQPIPDCQVDLILRLRHKERDRRRAG